VGSSTPSGHLDALACAELLLHLGLQVRAAIVKGRNLNSDREVVAREGGDTIFAIDRRVEGTLVAAIEAWPESLLPVMVVCEGLGHDGLRRVGPECRALVARVLIDPIDGTRPLMFDKRSGWFLATIAPDIGERTHLSDAVASVMVELPVSKQSSADRLWATVDRPTRAEREDLRTGAKWPIPCRPSNELTLRHGFAHVVSFFPGVKRLAADLMETIATATLGDVSISEAAIFDDQYTSTGGQLVELAMGRDRFCADLRPLFYKIAGLETEGLACHPYDMAGLLVAMQAGVEVTDGFGHPLDAPFDVTTGIHWCGYANRHLRAAIEPVIQTWLRDHL